MKFYDILGVNQNASKEDIKRAYKKAAVQHHPDKGGDAETFKKVGEAYAVLTDDDQRRRYDQIGDQGWESGGAQAQGSPVDPEAIFRNFFGFGGFGEGGFGGMPFGFGGPSFGNRGPSHPPKANDVMHGIRISLKDAFTGVQKHVRISLKKSCLRCKEQCHQCQGKGMIQDMVRNGLFTQIITRPCGTCHGTGKMSKPQKSCSQCQGVGETSEEHILTLKIPRGVQHGHHLHFGGFGEQPMVEGQRPGDLIFEIHIEDYPQLTRQGNDLHYEHNITLVESITGTVITVPHVMGEFKVDTREMGIIQPTKKYIIGQKGMSFGDGDAVGNMVVTFRVEYPKEKLTSESQTYLKDAFTHVGL
jgi:DnaJ-class molecular chaperone